jgi:microcystin-dependent protein
MLDGKTIGSAASGASARANTDCLNLYSILWNYTGLAIYTSAGVLTTRGASAALDFAAPANKRLALPDHSGRVMAARDNLSGTARGILNGYTGPGITGGEQTHQLSLAESASHGHVVGDHVHVGAGAPPSVFAFFNAGVIVSDLVTPTTGTGNWLGYLPANTTGIQSNLLTTDARGSDGAHNNIQPTIAVNVAIAL